eukprot:TRINITY_DN16146_c0_g3_i1.p1 TRINITY_DN16146_c0_g3~~TRINITY_DN16146_c0_g3_i1.p1  ORF type:complete len:520 (+),score=133.92 TRINITY_DN16146_c0_g3_i1:70-1560(+)
MGAGGLAAAGLVAAVSTAAAAVSGPAGALERYPPTGTGRYTTAVDHYEFRLPVQTFSLRYMVYSGFASGPGAAVMLYLGNEGAIETFYNATGAQFEHAEALGAHVVFIEHRYFGQSMPFGEGSLSPGNLTWLTIEQALADYAGFIKDLPSVMGQPVGKVVLFGGSYGGMLAVYHRLKYPHLTAGAVASGSSLDIWPSENSQGAFRDAYIGAFDKYGGTSGCGARVRAALKAAAAATADDLAAAGIRTCAPFDEDPTAPEKLGFYLEGAISSIAMVDYPYPTNFISPLPANPVMRACSMLEHAGSTDAGLLSGAADVVGMLVNGTGQQQCWDLNSELVGDSRPPAGGHSGSSLGVTSWNYLACTELPLEPITSDGYGFFVTGDGAQTEQLTRRCAELFKVRTRPEWLPESFGNGRDLAGALSNTFLGENDKDPWHIGTDSIAALIGNSTTARGLTRRIARGGAHHQELRFTSPLDAPEVAALRLAERAAIRAWLAQG